MSSPRPIIIVTGANGGVGFGVCHRLLFQLAETTPSDALPRFWDGIVRTIPTLEPCDGLTLIMACRSLKRGEAAREQLLCLLDTHVAKLRRQSEQGEHAVRFRQNLRIDLLLLDLASVDSVFKFANEVSRRYPYISHLVCNAGVASFTGIDYFLLLKAILQGPVRALTYPTYNTQSKGERSADALGWIWQCNVFGHYALFRSIQPLLQKSKSPLGSRVVWMSSMEGTPQFFDADDWQLTRTEHSYEASKYQMDLIGSTLDQRALKDSSKGEPRHFIVHPGVASTKVASALASGFLDTIKVILFYLIRWLGSPNHPISTFKAAIPAVYVMISPLVLLPSFLILPSADSPPGPATEGKPVTTNAPVKYGAQTDRWGTERVGVSSVIDWNENKEAASILVDKCEDLYLRLKGEHGRFDVETASEWM